MCTGTSVEFRRITLLISSNYTSFWDEAVDFPRHSQSTAPSTQSDFTFCKIIRKGKRNSLRLSFNYHSRMHTRQVMTSVEVLIVNALKKHQLALDKQNILLR